MNKPRKLMIVIEDVEGDGKKGFNIYLDGDKERLGTTNMRDLTSAERWAFKLFAFCTAIVKQASTAKAAPSDPEEKIQNAD